ncbi:enolase C-terminal domain-like protein [Marinitenerispora sediminis]|uniref:O-succinylbenzoate synthase n=1 Tax=Marinitenerispora sediminis TaxID=1931232 RepID=A0A368T8B3_9ACTN|nr:enolase C-terminal domain-like protein [Marinitenerispora sediminis]RCV52637.1 O-succinylbenzoate synthase [Marinitenerispora sediminis]RCV60325.1 O-succinylbenzoate synthase [Marinitenerispora sediminis]RCV60578.1 O-succinylbenzoate synthase [Marinitenerispora sediminis]
MSRTEPATLTRVATVDVTRVRLPLVHPKPRHRPDGGRPRFAERILVRVCDPSGASGWGEVPVADSERWRSLVRDFAPALLRHAWQRPTDVAAAWEDLPADPAVESGLDIACWDLWSRQRGTPLSHALGGSRTAVTAGVTVTRQPSLESLVYEVNRQVGSGFRRIRLEIEPGWDVEAVRAVQAAYPFLVLQVTGSGRYTEDPEHLAALHALDEYGLLAIEQPFPAGDLAAHARLRRDLRTPVALDSSIDSLETLDEAIRLEAAGALNLRPARMGGLTPARRAHDRAVDAGWQVWCGADQETGIGRAAHVALASLPGVTLPSETSGAGGWFTRDVVSPPVRSDDGVIPVPLTQPGLGHTVDERAVRALAVRSTRLSAED